MIFNVEKIHAIEFQLVMALGDFKTHHMAL
jgi:hypothetical protein